MAEPQAPMPSDIEQAATDAARHAYREAERACAGNIGKLADLCFRQAKVSARTSELLITTGCTVLAAGMRKGAVK